MRFNNLDLLKGFLILLVILGHLLQGGTSESMPRYVIYSFHMPLFVGLSGFLFKPSSIISLLSKYKYRVILPWVIAIVSYFIYTGGSFVKAFVVPFYHLWYIPAFLSWSILYCLFHKFKYLFIGSLLFSVAFFILRKFPDLYRDIEIVRPIIKGSLYTLRPYYFVFFVTGAWLRDKQFNLKPIAIVSFIALIFQFFYPDRIFYMISFYVFNLSLLSICINWIKKDFLPNYRPVEWIGINSLGIYLWHVFPILLVKEYIGTEDIQMFYFFGIGSLGLFFIAFIILSRVNFINYYFFGVKN
jgi:fucose 4-O-acetylase-like acetyltransferase